MRSNERAFMTLWRGRAAPAATLSGKRVISLLALAWASAGFAQYNVVWDSPSADHSGSMPLGNGDISVNAWVEPPGDLVFYIGKTDSWDDNARLLKVGKVRVKCDPPLVASGTVFRQELDLSSGMLQVSSSLDTRHSTLSLWVDANNPAIEVELASDRDFAATASFELWRTNSYTLPSIECSDVMNGDPSKRATVVEPDTVIEHLGNRIGWYHQNTKSVGPAMHAETQGMKGCPREEPLLHRTFGAVIAAGRGQRVDDTHLRSPASTSHRFSVHVLTMHPATPEAWLSAMTKTIADTDTAPFGKRRADHEAWWRAFWDRSWIRATTRTDASAAASLIPLNDHPLRIGVDQSGQNKFRGEIRNARVPETLGGSFTLEAEVKPAAGETGRIFDKITPGGADGFLIDAVPGNSLRLIHGSAQHVVKNALPAGQWAHVVATITPDGWRVSVDGKAVIEAPIAGVGDDAAYVSQMYALQRYITACAGRGRYPIKFNGSLFTVPPGAASTDGDYRRWGPGYWWQNTRLPYIGLCASGDVDMMEPLFRMYVDELLPVNKYRTKHYFGLDDAAYYIECIHFWGDVFNQSYGWTPMEKRKDPLQEAGWHKWEWVAGPELVYMMLDAWEHTGDEALLKKRILPTARAVTRFFDGYYKTNDTGKLVMHPSQAVETWWNCTNPMPELAGLIAVTARLLALPEGSVSAEDRAYWKAFQARLPELPTREIPGGRALAPAERFAQKSNCENPELYGVFPFRLCSFNRPNAELGANALKHRWDGGSAGWRQDDIFMAYLGLADDAKKNLVGRARNHDRGSRFPAFWGPNYDWIPDQDHGGVLMKAFQAMVMQVEPATGSAYDGKIYVLPAWPKEWDVAFKLHAPRNTVVEGEYRGGKLVRLDVTPASRRKDVEVISGGGTPPLRFDQ
jgi:hypothetical protein